MAPVCYETAVASHCVVSECVAGFKSASVHEGGSGAMKLAVVRRSQEIDGKCFYFAGGWGPVLPRESGEEK